MHQDFAGLRKRGAVIVVQCEAGSPLRPKRAALRAAQGFAPSLPRTGNLKHPWGILIVADEKARLTPHCYETISLIERKGGRAVFFRADVRKEEQVRDLVSSAEAQFGGVDILVNNASAPHGQAIESWMDSLETDLLGAIYATRWAIEVMRRKGEGAIVNVASISALWHGRKTPGGFPGFDIAKAGISSGRALVPVPRITKGFDLRLRLAAIALGK